MLFSGYPESRSIRVVRPRDKFGDGGIDDQGRALIMTN